LVLAVSAVCAIGYGIALAIGQEDTEPLESPLIMSVARQVTDGPSGLYGPFDGKNPWVLIHAPLYYRVSALLAWAGAHLGESAVRASALAGRLISIAGLAVTMAAAFRIANLDGGSRRAGWWSISLIAAAPVLGTQPFAVRPDLLAVALETVGILWIAKSLFAPAGGPTVLLGFVAFGLAACVKQHLVAIPFLSAVLCVAAGRARAAVGGILAAIAIVGLVYGVEEIASLGRMGHAIIGAASHVGKIHPGEWARVQIIFLAIGGRSAGIMTFFWVAALAAATSGAGLSRRSLAAAGLLVVLGLVGVETWYLEVWDARTLAIRSSIIFLTPAIMLPACALINWRSVAGGGLDRVLWLFVAGELVIVAALSYVSTGAWVNYAIQAVVLGSILTARAADRGLRDRANPLALFALAIGVLAIPSPLAFTMYSDVNNRRYDDSAAKFIISHYNRPAHEFFFVDRPGLNRVNGRADLVYDDWLYPVFESYGLAEHRAIWLTKKLVDGGIRFVVTTSQSSQVDGLPLPLTRLGYASRSHAGSFYVWESTRNPIPPPR
jgi:hypothetical protein